MQRRRRKKKKKKKKKKKYANKSALGKKSFDASLAVDVRYTS